MAVAVDHEKCIGCGACVAMCADVFEMKDDGKAHVKAGAENGECESALGACPVQAITK